MNVGTKSAVFVDGSQPDVDLFIASLLGSVTPVAIPFCCGK